MRRSRALDRPGKTREGTCRLPAVANNLFFDLNESRSRKCLRRLHADRLVTVIGPAQGRGKTSSGLQGHAERSSSGSALETNEPIASSPSPTPAVLPVGGAAAAGRAAIYLETVTALSLIHI